MSLPPKTRCIEVPEGGWEERAFYAVMVSVSPGNPIWGAIFHTGFLDSEGQPGGYSAIWSPTAGSPISLAEVHYLKTLYKLDVPLGYLSEAELLNYGCRPSDEDPERLV